jgi:hypothetical protein
MEENDMKNTKTSGKNITEDAKHFLADIENDRIPPLYSEKLKNIARDNGINPDDSAVNITKKLQELRNDIFSEETGKKEGARNETEETKQKKENNDPTEDLKKRLEMLRGEILMEQIRTPHGTEESPKTKQKQAELSELEKQMDETKKSENPSVQEEDNAEKVAEVKKKIDEILLKKDDSEHGGEIDKPLSETEQKKQTDGERAFQKLDEPLVVKEGEDFLHALKMRLGGNEYFNNKFTGREQHFILDSLTDDIRHFPRGKEVDIGSIIGQNKDIRRIFKKYE